MSLSPSPSSSVSSTHPLCQSFNRKAIIRSSLSYMFVPVQAAPTIELISFVTNSKESQSLQLLNSTLTQLTTSKTLTKKTTTATILTMPSITLPANLEDLAIERFDQLLQDGELFYQSSDPEYATHNDFQVIIHHIK